MEDNLLHAYDVNKSDERLQKLSIDTRIRFGWIPLAYIKTDELKTKIRNHRRLMASNWRIVGCYFDLKVKYIALGLDERNAFQLINVNHYLPHAGFASPSSLSPSLSHTNTLNHKNEIAVQQTLHEWNTFFLTISACSLEERREGYKSKTQFKFFIVNDNKCKSRLNFFLRNDSRFSSALNDGSVKKKLNSHIDAIIRTARCIAKRKKFSTLDIEKRSSILNVYQVIEKYGRSIIQCLYGSNTLFPSTDLLSNDNRGNDGNGNDDDGDEDMQEIRYDDILSISEASNMATVIRENKNMMRDVEACYYIAHRYLKCKVIKPYLIYIARASMDFVINRLFRPTLNPMPCTFTIGTGFGPEWKSLQNISDIECLLTGIKLYCKNNHYNTRKFIAFVLILKKLKRYSTEHTKHVDYNAISLCTCISPYFVTSIDHIANNTPIPYK